MALIGARFGHTEISAQWPVGLDARITQWDGGVDTLIHPHWDGNVPPLDLFIVPTSNRDTFTAIFEVVADGAATLTEKREEQAWIARDQHYEQRNGSRRVGWAAIPTTN